MRTAVGYEMQTRNISLTEHFNRFIDQQIRSGRFRNASEVMRAGLHLLEREEQEHRKKLAALRAMAAEAAEQIERGEGIPFSNRAELDELIEQASRRASKQVKRRTAV